MFRIRRVYDDVAPRNKEAIAQVQQILRTQFPGISEPDIAKLSIQLRNPLRYRFNSMLFVADDARGQVKGFALLLHMPDRHFCYLEFIATAQQQMGSGIGGALYERVREEARALQAIGLFFECLPDDPAVCSDPALLAQNAARLRFYEAYGARPIIHTAYSTPISPEDKSPQPYLVFDSLGQDTPLSKKTARAVIQAILERKYGHLCSPTYIQMVVQSVVDDPVQLREPKYILHQKPAALRKRPSSTDRRIILVINDQQAIHHVHERGYVESPVRIRVILREIQPTGLFEEIRPRHFAEEHIRAVHDPRFVEYLKKVCANVEPGKSIYPYVFPIRNATRPPHDLPVRAGYYCIDTFTPLNHNAYAAAKRGVDCALTATQKILEGYPLAYALVRPPGHHAERRAFGGFCYFNSAAIAAHYLSAYGKVVVLDIDYHHGNGTQDIFYERSDVLTISIHGHPRFAYPYFSGFEDEKGVGAGEGYNLNVPLPEQVDGTRYREVLSKVLRRVTEFKPDFFIIALGLDTAKGDPTGTWSLRPADFAAIGKMISTLQFPTLIVQEGGYNTRSLGINARHFFLGLWEGSQARSTLKPPKKQGKQPAV